MVSRAIVSAIIRNSEGKYLVLRRALGARLAPGIWEFLSGTPDKGEANEAAMLREVQEEIAVSGQIQEKLSAFEVTDDEGRWIVTPYIVAISDESITISQEHSAYRWVSLKDILNDKKLSKDLSFFSPVLPRR